MSSSFFRPKFDMQGSNQNALTTLPDLVEFNALYNPSRLFCVQYTHHIYQVPRRITYKELHHAVLRCSTSLEKNGLKQPPTRINQKARPVALLMASDVTWFIYFISLLRLGVPVLSMSARLAPYATAHLLKETDAQAVLTSSQLDPLVEEATSLLPEKLLVIHALPYGSFADGDLPATSWGTASRSTTHDDKNVVILHSSGTTGMDPHTAFAENPPLKQSLGLPKPIYHSHAYLLGYASCHRLSPEDVAGAMNLSTLPLYHGYGLLAPCLSLSIGLPFALPACTTIPTGSSTMSILSSCRATSLMTVPSILEEIYTEASSKSIDALRALRFVAVGGAPMKYSVAEPLANAGVPILNHWGVTEIGAIAPIHIPEAEYDWRYLRLRDDINLRIEPVDSGDDAQYYRLIGRAPGSRVDFVVQDLLTVNPERPCEVRVVGRADELIVLATGEKVRPSLLEQQVSEDPLVKVALAFGDGRFQLGLIVEAAGRARVNVSDPKSVTAYLDRIWPSVVQGNDMMDHHARVTREMIIVTTQAGQPLLRTPKGSIARNPNMELFKRDIDVIYRRADVTDAKALPIGNPSRLREVIRKAVQECLTIPRAIADEDDFFERGMDSLQAASLRRCLAAAVASTSKSSGNTSNCLPLDFVYTHPSITRLQKGLIAYLTSNKRQGTSPSDRIHQLRSVAEEYVRKVADLRPAPSTGDPRKDQSIGRKVVLLTGSTGSLGSAMLAELVMSADVSKVYALNRRGTRSLRSRQEEGLRRLGVRLGDDWQKIVLLEGDLASDRFGLDKETYLGLTDVSHVIHNAWPMCFNRSLSSFRPHLEGSRNIIQLALDSRACTPVNVLFSSSISTVGRYPLTTGQGGPVKETALDNPQAVDHFGYAEAKWVCEKMFEKAGRAFPSKILPHSIRIGQLVGSDATGAWNSYEHIPMIVKSCQAIGCLPIIDGVSTSTANSKIM
ncbi:hypothetical protein PHLCEN_2v10200 [Hermanssonia centrifuga]|uniref:Uncharacterized protein n=1 Tax=Hermanssonia centrifuga TaxID=98765 RepID=A0A2R6NNM4_9APHY|nr:hypothetical protein PHLCEN_2v10200 [Hermanssonia centrifuga]